jgi:hypothetical protein
MLPAQMLAFRLPAQPLRHLLQGGWSMHSSKSLVAVMSLLVLGFFTAAPASAYVACNSSGDCWRTGSKTHYEGVIVTYHDDDWWDSHKADAQYHWHEADADHRSDHGYWRNGAWVGGL